MKIYTRIVMDWDGNVLESEGYEYDGPVALCWGPSGQSHGQGGTDTDDSAGMGVGPAGTYGGTAGNQGGQSHGQGGTDTDDSAGMGVGPPGTYGGMQSTGHTGGGWTSSPHGNPQGVGLTQHTAPVNEQSITPAMVNLAYDQDLQTIPGMNTFSNQMRSAYNHVRDSGIGYTLAGVFSGNPIGMAIGAKGPIGYSADMTAARSHYGLGPMTGPPGFGQMAGTPASGVALTRPYKSPTQEVIENLPITGNELGLDPATGLPAGARQDSENPNLHHVAHSDPNVAGMVATTPVTSFVNDPLAMSMRLAFRQKMAEAKKQVVLSSLGGMR